MFCKAATENDRKTVCAFLNKLKGRAEQSGGNTRDPVTWKQWADSLLVSTSNMAELRVAKEEEYEDLEKEIAGIKSEIDGLNAGRDQTKANLAYQRGLVDRLEKELLMATRKNAELDRATKEVRVVTDKNGVGDFPVILRPNRTTVLRGCVSNKSAAIHIQV